jgi:hypothetical protein
VIGISEVNQNAGKTNKRIIRKIADIHQFVKPGIVHDSRKLQTGLTMPKNLFKIIEPLIKVVGENNIFHKTCFGIKKAQEQQWV